MCTCPMEQITTGETREAPDGKATQVSLEKLKLCCTTSFYLAKITIKEKMPRHFCSNRALLQQHLTWAQKGPVPPQAGLSCLSLPSPALSLLSSKPLDSLGL